MAVLGVAIVYWILMSNFLQNTLEFGQGTLILYTVGTVNDVIKNTSQGLYSSKTMRDISTLSFPYNEVRSKNHRVLEVKDPSEFFYGVFPCDIIDGPQCIPTPFSVFCTSILIFEYCRLRKRNVKI